jgi:hypothetical protein
MQFSFLFPWEHIVHDFFNGFKSDFFESVRQYE